MAFISTATAVAAAASGCTGGDSTVSKTPTNTFGSSAASSAATASPHPGANTPPPPVDPCAVNLKDRDIATVVALLPPAPNTNAGWNPVPVAGNYNKCSVLSAVIVAADTHEPHPGTRAVFFHQGSVIASGIPDTYGYNGIDLAASTPDTVVLNFSNGIPGLDSVVKFHWNGTGVEVLHEPPQ